jgi:hypothetical protein
MTGYHSKRRRSYRALSLALGLAAGLAGGLAGLLLIPCSVRAEETEAIEPEAITWARIEFLRNQVQLLPNGDEQARRANVSDVLDVGDSLRTLRRSRAELRFSDDSLARIGERATFQFTPNTRNFQLTNGTVLLLIPPNRGRSTIQTPNAVTGIQGSALFVRYIPETDTTIVGALTDNPNGPMILFNRDGSEQQALQANEIGVIEGDQITQLYRFDSLLFWQSSGLAEGFDYLGDNTSTGSDALDGVRQEIRDAIAKQDPLPSEGEGIIENPASFSRPAPVEATPSGTTPNGTTSNGTAPNGTAPATGGTGSSTTNGTSPSPGSSTTTTPNGTAPATGGTGSSTTNGTGASPGSSTTTTGTSPGSSTGGANSSGSSSSGSSNSSPGGNAQPGNGSTPSTNSLPPVTSPTPVTSPGTSPTPIELPTSPLSPVLPPTPGSVGANENLQLIQEPVIKIEFRGTPAESYLTGTPISRPLTEIIGGTGATGTPVTGTPTTVTPATGTPPTGSGVVTTPQTTLNSPGTSTPNSTPAPIISGTTPSPTSATPVVPSVPGAVMPETITIPETVVNPEIAVPVTLPSVTLPSISSPATDIPLQPEIGGNPVENVIEPVQLPVSPSNGSPQTGSNTPTGGNSGSGTPTQTPPQTPPQGGSTPVTPATPTTPVTPDRVLL